jgi:hypothetical protein
VGRALLAAAQDVRGDLGRRRPLLLGALGLPVNYKDGYVVNAEHRNEKLRRASPLWLRPVGGATGWRLFSFAFLGDFLPGPDAPSVQLRDIVIPERCALPATTSPVSFPS